jgi:hypothetical protein
MQAGGAFVGEGMLCENNACAMEGACCFGGGATCEVLQASSCSVLGEFLGAGMDCTECLVPGACCLPDNTCQEVTLPLCLQLDGRFEGIGSECVNTVCDGSPLSPSGRAPRSAARHSLAP